MSECLDFPISMTGSTNSGPLQPHKDSSPLPARFASLDRDYTPESPSTHPAYRHQRFNRKMTLTPPSGQPIQLTPLWEHVVRTRKFPTAIDSRLTFLEITERLRDPEWEVRQHALRVLIDVLPTLSVDIVDKVMQPVIPELINNLGHPAPAVRKGALDALRVYLVHSREREDMVKKILQDGLNRSETHDSFQTNVTTGVILSAPSLLFPSSTSTSPTVQLLKDTTIALATRLAHVAHQEAVLKSLMKIRDAVGAVEFENYLADYDNKLIRNIEILSKIYNVRPASKKSPKKTRGDAKNEEDDGGLDRKWETDSDTSGIVEEEDELNNGAMPPARIVLETEIKFNEETAITMTILEEKEEYSNKEQDEESGTDLRNDAETAELKEGDSSLDRRKTPRRVRFGGEIVKLRTPDSDESIEVTPKTRIPVPVSPATKMPERLGRPSSQPCSPRREKREMNRTSRSVSSSPKREVHAHNADLSPKKSILARTNSPLLSNQPERMVSMKKKRNSVSNLEEKDFFEAKSGMRDSFSKSLEDSKMEEPRKKDGGRLVQSAPSIGDSSHLTNGRIKGARGSLRLEESAGHLSIIDAQVPKSALSKVNGEVARELLCKEGVINDSSVEQVVRRSSIVELRRSDSLFGPVVDQDQGNDTFDKKIHVEKAVEKSSRSNRVVANARETSVDSNVNSNQKKDNAELKDDEKRRSSIVLEKNENLAAGLEADKSGEQSWEELGLVDREVLEDLHNKDDWRARVRGFERVASALRTSSALIAIEPRLGSLLHAVLGCERSCRVAAAGLAVAKIVVAGVNEEALMKRLPQLAWGLVRQGGPSAAQLARITMLRLKPILLLEQLLQPQCLNARNAKTRENTLQLLIFSLVTFPSTEFKVEIVANKVAKMVADRRRRVRQAALDTIAVLAQIYNSEEVLAAGKRAAEGRHDGEAMISAIRARLARKSLPLVSADGLIVYGLQISPTVQIATGPDVDWIVAGSGSVSPGTGRTRGQVIATRSEKGKSLRNGNAKSRGSPWIERPNFVALGVGIPKTEQPVAWQIMPVQNQVDSLCEDDLNVEEEAEAANSDTEIHNGKNSDPDLRSKDKSESSVTSRDLSEDYRSIVENSLRLRRNLRSIERNVNGKESTGKAESRIPVLFSRDRAPKTSEQCRERISNLELASSGSRKKSKDTLESIDCYMNSREGSLGSCGAAYQRRKSGSRISTTTKILNRSFDPSCNNHQSVIAAKKSSGKEYTEGMESTSQEPSETYYRNFRHSTDRERFLRKTDSQSRYSRSNSSDSHQRLLSKNSQQQNFVMHGMYNAFTRRIASGNNSSRPMLQTAPTPLTRVYGEENFNLHSAVSYDKSFSSRAKFYRRMKDASSQKNNEVELTSSDAQTNGDFSAINDEIPCRRRLRSLSPSQLYHPQLSARTTSNEYQAMSMFDIDKAVSEEEYNERNKHHFLPESTIYQVLNNAETPFKIDNRDSTLSKSASSSSSELSRDNRNSNAKEVVRRKQDFSDTRSSSPQSQDADAAFEIIIAEAGGSPNQDMVESYGKLGLEAEPRNASNDDDTSKDWSSEEDIIKLKNPSIGSRLSQPAEFRIKDSNESDNVSLDDTRLTDSRNSSRKRSIVSTISNDKILANDVLQKSISILRSSYLKDYDENVASPSGKQSSPKKSETLYSTRSPSRTSNDFDASKSSSRRNSCNTSRKLSFDRESIEFRDSSEERLGSSVSNVEKGSFPSLSQIQSRRESKTGDSPTIIIASRPHSTETTDLIESNREAGTHLDDIDNGRRFIDESAINENFDDLQSKDSASETNTEPAILKIETDSVEPIHPPKRMPSKVPRAAVRLRPSLTKGNHEKPEKLKPSMQQCFNQLESKDWEVTMKGLKTLTQITKQHPEYLDMCVAGTLGRLLGRHIKSLRSQVARAACLVAGDIFSSQIRGIDQDIDDIVGPLLHRTADTNRFLRADSNAALDRMVEHIPPHKIIGIIVQRGANHQNAIVRASTVRLLAEIVDRVGSEHTMILPRDVKDKLLATGAKMLMDGNLDARNHAKKMFRKLIGCEGFRRALMDAVPDSTLRHIDKTLKSL